MWRKRKDIPKKHSVRDTAARMIASRIVQLQVRLAGLLNGYARHYSARQKKIALLLFCILFGGYCLYLLGRAAFGTPRQRSGTEFNKGSPPVLLPPGKRNKDQ